MVHFVRFIFTLVVAGIILSLALVVLSDFRSQHIQAAAVVEERKLFDDLIARYNRQLRSGNIAVEWQKTSATGEVLETSLLIRRYLIASDGRQDALPIKRIVLPGARVCVDGLTLDFDALFNEEFKNMRSVQLAYFGRIYCEQQPVADRFSFLQEGQVPDATMVHKDHATHSEEHLWQYLWGLIGNPDQVDPQMLDRAAKQGLKISWKPAACSVVKNGMVYSIFVGQEGVTLRSNDDPSLLNDMLREAQEQDQEHGESSAENNFIQRQGIARF